MPSAQDPEWRWPRSPGSRARASRRRDAGSLRRRQAEDQKARKRKATVIPVTNFPPRGRLSSEDPGSKSMRGRSRIPLYPPRNAEAGEREERGFTVNFIAWSNFLGQCLLAYLLVEGAKDVIFGLRTPG